MPITLTGTFAGSAQTGLTNPTYTAVADTAPTYNGKQSAVTSLGGTQTGVSTHTPAVPFTVTFVRPAVLKTVAPTRTNSNQLLANNRNKYLLMIRKGGLLVPSSDIYGTSIFRGEWDIPAGMDTAAAPELRAQASILMGLIDALAENLGDALVTGIV